MKKILLLILILTCSTKYLSSSQTPVKHLPVRGGGGGGGGGASAAYSPADDAKNTELKKAFDFLETACEQIVELQDNHLENGSHQKKNKVLSDHLIREPLIAATVKSLHVFYDNCKDLFPFLNKQTSQKQFDSLVQVATDFINKNDGKEDAIGSKYTYSQSIYDCVNTLLICLKEFKNTGKKTPSKECLAKLNSLIFNLDQAISPCGSTISFLEIISPIKKEITEDLFKKPSDFTADEREASEALLAELGEDPRDAVTQDLADRFRSAQDDDNDNNNTSTDHDNKDLDETFLLMKRSFQVVFNNNLSKIQKMTDKQKELENQIKDFQISLKEAQETISENQNLSENELAAKNQEIVNLQKESVSLENEKGFLLTQVELLQERITVIKRNKAAECAEKNSEILRQQELMSMRNEESEQKLFEKKAEIAQQKDEHETELATKATEIAEKNSEILRQQELMRMSNEESEQKLFEKKAEIAQQKDEHENELATKAAELARQQAELARQQAKLARQQQLINKQNKEFKQTKAELHNRLIGSGVQKSEIAAQLREEKIKEEKIKTENQLFMNHLRDEHISVQNDLKIFLKNEKIKKQQTELAKQQAELARQQQLINKQNEEFKQTKAELHNRLIGSGVQKSEIAAQLREEKIETEQQQTQYLLAKIKIIRNKLNNDLKRFFQIKEQKSKIAEKQAEHETELARQKAKIAKQKAELAKFKQKESWLKRGIIGVVVAYGISKTPSVMHFIGSGIGSFCRRLSNYSQLWLSGKP